MAEQASEQTSERAVERAVGAGALDPRQVQPERAPAAGAEAAGARGGAHRGAQDPLRLCIFATVSLLGWLLGPVALLVFAALGFAGYHGARRAGLLHSRCLLGSTRNILAYLAVLVVLAVAGIVWRVAHADWSPL